MKTVSCVNALRLLITTFAALTVAWGAGHATVGAQGRPVIQTFPSPGLPGPPRYANLAAGFMPTDNGTVAIVFGGATRI